MTSERDLSIWEGDGLPEFEDWWDFTCEITMTGAEIDGWIEACKSEAWVHEKLAKYENAERNLAVARYFWRRTERLREFRKQHDERLDREVEEESA